MAAFSRALVREFEGRATRQIAQEYPRPFAALGEGRVRDLVRQGISRAGSYGIALETDVLGFIEMTIAVHPRFDELEENDWVREVLGDTGASPAIRIEILRKRFAAELREAAAA